MWGICGTNKVGSPLLKKDTLVKKITHKIRRKKKERGGGHSQV
jgi:hypothetical protein